MHVVAQAMALAFSSVNQALVVRPVPQVLNPVLVMAMNPRASSF